MPFFVNPKDFILYMVQRRPLKDINPIYVNGIFYVAYDPTHSDANVAGSQLANQLELFKGKTISI